MISQRRFDALLKRLYDGNSTIVAGVSGGPDSICMLHLLASSSLSPRVVVAHLNFSLRGEESNGDMRFVEERAKFYGFPFLCKTADTRAYAKERSLSIEIAAREIRYKWFGEILSSYAPAVLAVAHNANDNAETLLLNLLRGTGIKGLCGIAERAPLPYRDNDKYEVIRPLLSFEREEIEEYLASNSLQARIDSTNALCDVARNRIRNIIIPQMRQINPSAVRRLNMDIANFADAYLLLQQGLSNCKESYVLYRTGGKLPLSGQSGQGVQFRLALLKRYLQLMLDGKALAAAGGTALLLELLEEFNFPATMLEEVAESLKRSSAAPQCDAKFWRTERYTMVLEEGNLYIYLSLAESEGRTPLPDALIQAEPQGALVQAEPQGALVQAEPQGALIQADSQSGFARAGIIPLKNGLIFSYMFYEWEGEGTPVEHCKRLSDGNLLTLDADSITFPLRLRPAKSGDFFAPLGMKRGNKRINDYLGERKVERLLREHAQVLEDAGGRVVALVGFQVAEGARVTEKSRRLMTLTLQYNG